MRIPLAFALPALVALSGITPDAYASDARGKPNIVFILADDLGWTDLGCQGSKY